MITDVENNVSVIIKTFERPHCVKLLYRSIRRFYPNIPVLIADDSKSPLDGLGDARIIQLPYNSGVSHGRNAALNEVSTKYFVTVDDDFLFTENTNLLIPYRVLETTDFDVVGIELLYSGWKKRIFRGSYAKKGDVIWRLQNQPSATHKGYPVYHYLLQCFMAKTEVIKASPWDEVFQTAYEHDDFFLGLKKKNILITHVNNVSMDHYSEMIGSYKKIREDTDPDKKEFLKKHQIKDIKEKGRGFPYWQTKLDSFLKFIRLQKAFNNLIKNYKLRHNGIL